jgi:uncharacterized protein YqeY
MPQADSAEQFLSASPPRTDLADQVEREVAVLTPFIPSLMPEEEIRTVLQEIAAGQVSSDISKNAKAGLGQVFKQFYSRVDKSLVDPEAVKRLAEDVLTKS